MTWGWQTLSFIMRHAPEYRTIHYFGYPRHTQSMIAYIIFSEYFWKFQWKWGTFRDDRTSRLPYLSTLYFRFTVIIGENLLSSFFSFTFNPTILQSLISSQLTTWFCHYSQKTSMPLENCIVGMLVTCPIWWQLEHHNQCCITHVS